jgi:hypothetical protein
VVWRLARASSHLPSSTSVITTAEASKYRCSWPCAPATARPTAPSRLCADGHQQVHVAGAGLQRMPAGAVEARAQHELHRRRQHELQPGRQHPVLARTGRPASAAPAAATAAGRWPPARSRPTATGPPRPPARGARLVAGVAHGAADRASISSEGANTTRADSVARLTRGVLHARHLLQRRSTRFTQEAQVMPPTPRSSVALGPGWQVSMGDRRPCHDGKVKAADQPEPSLHGLTLPWWQGSSCGSFDSVHSKEP